MPKLQVTHGKKDDTHYLTAYVGEGVWVSISEAYTTKSGTVIHARSSGNTRAEARRNIRAEITRLHREYL